MKLLLKEETAFCLFLNQRLNSQTQKYTLTQRDTLSGNVAATALSTHTQVFLKI